jgi:hypothetical protein
MAEYVDRIHAQRGILESINSISWSEDLFGLSRSAISRWAERNGIDADSEVLRLLQSASEMLGFMANKSQQSMSDEYRQKSAELKDLTAKLYMEIRRQEPAGR